MANYGLIAPVGSPGQIAPAIAANHASAATEYVYGAGANECFWSFTAPGPGVIEIDTWMTTGSDGVTTDPNTPKTAPFARISRIDGDGSASWQSLATYDSKMMVTFSRAGTIQIGTIGVNDLNDSSTFSDPVYLVLNSASTDFIMDDVGTAPSAGGGGSDPAPEPEPEPEPEPTSYDVAYAPTAGDLTYPVTGYSQAYGWALDWGFGSEYVDGHHPEYWADQQPSNASHVTRSGFTRTVTGSWSGSDWWDGVGCHAAATFDPPAPPAMGFELTSGTVSIVGRMGRFGQVVGSEFIAPASVTVRVRVGADVLGELAINPAVSSYTPLEPDLNGLALTAAQAQRILAEGEQLTVEAVGMSDGDRGLLRIDQLVVTGHWEEGVGPAPSILADQRGQRRIFF